MNFEQLIALYFESPAYKSLSFNSLRIYDKYLGRLATMGKGIAITDRAMRDRVARSRSRSPEFKGNLTNFWWNAINHFEMENGSKATNTTKNTLHTFLKVAYRFAITEKDIDCTEGDNPTNFGRWASKAAPVNPLQLEEIDAIKVSVADPSYPEDVKPYAMFWLAMFYMGLRPSDMENHETTWFQKKKGARYYEVWGGKGKVKGAISRLVHLGEEEEKVLAYFEGQPVWMGHEKYTFRTNTGKKFNQSSYMGEKIRMVCTLAGIPPREMYDARRGLVTEMFKANVPLPQIQHRVGHASLKTTERYARLSNEAKANIGVLPKGFGA